VLYVKTKRALALILMAALAGLVSLSLCACDLFSFGGRNEYDVTSELGYEDNAGEWISSAVSPDSEARRLYEEVKAEGYEGSFLDFLKEINVTVPTDDSEKVSSALMSAVSIECGFNEYDYNNHRTEAKLSAGAGFIYSLNKTVWDAYVVTNYHVVYNADSTGKETVKHISDDITLYLYGSETPTRALRATYVGGAMDYDIAVLKVEGSTFVETEVGGVTYSHYNRDVLKASGAREVTAADSDAVVPGQRAYAIGNPKGEGMAVTAGVVSVDAEYIDILASDDKTKISLLEIRIDAAINHGNSGGGLFDKDGKLIGVVNARSEEEGTTAFGYALPANLSLSVVQNILDNQLSGSRGALLARLGVTVQTADSYSVYDETQNKTYVRETVTVHNVDSNGAANGAVKAGDIIRSIKIVSATGVTRAEKTITRQHQISALLFNVRLTDTVELTVQRGQETVTAKIVFADKTAFELFD